MNKFQIGNRVRTLIDLNEDYRKGIGLIGTIESIDFTEYPFDVSFEDGDCISFKEYEIELLSEVEDNKLIVICGKSGSGKSVLEKLIDSRGLARKVISTTTRNIRSYEVDGEDYYFLPIEVFNAYLKQGQYAEWSEYTTVNGKALYGINKNDIKLDKYRQVCVVNPHGFEQLVDKLGKENIISIYLVRDDRERVLSALKRDNDDFKTVLKEVSRRFEADEIDFADMESKVDYVINNDDDIETVYEKVESIFLKNN